MDIEFNYEHKKTIIQGNLNDLFEEIIQKYITKTNLDINDIYFLSNGKYINKKDKLENIMNEDNKKNKTIQILVYSKDDTKKNDNKNFKISKDIICPQCKEICKYKIKDYKIQLYDCKQKHSTEIINLNEYENKQKIDIS